MGICPPTQGHRGKRPEGGLGRPLPSEATENFCDALGEKVVHENWQRKCEKARKPGEKINKYNTLENIRYFSVSWGHSKKKSQSGQTYSKSLNASQIVHLEPRFKHMF